MLRYKIAIVTFQADPEKVIRDPLGGMHSVQVEGYIPKNQIRKIETGTVKTFLAKAQDKSLSYDMKKLKELGTTDTIPMGQCFPWALKFMKTHKDATLVHAEVFDKWKKKWYWHGWVEQDGKVYDWQTSARTPLSVKDFREIYTPRNENRYDYADALLNAFKTKHYGPWIPD